MQLTNDEVVKAFKAAKTAKLVEMDKVEKVFRAYVSGYGSAIVNVGLLPAVVFNERDEKHQRVNNTLLLMVKSEDDKSEGSLVDWIFNSKQSGIFILHQLQKALLALKMVLRAYPDATNENQNL